MSLKLKEAFDPDGEDAIERAARDYDKAKAALEAVQRERDTLILRRSSVALRASCACGGLYDVLAVAAN